MIVLYSSASLAVAPIKPQQLTTLAKHPAWLKLLHYRNHSTETDSSNFSGYSTVIDKGFFLAPDGASNPRAELQASILSLLQTPQQHCRFPARSQWLQQQLPELPWPAPASCPVLEQFLHQALPGTIVMSFAKGFMSSPGSIFGHTFFRLDKANHNAHLLNPTLNFEAQTGPDRGLQYKALGLTGGFVGKFSILPFHKQLNRHYRGELRDLWDYPLRLTDEQQRLLLLHYWEIRKAKFHYYFMTENCVTQLLALIEVARPDLDLIGAAGYTVMPDQALRLLQEQQLLAPPAYRPALRMQLQAAASQLPTKVLTAALQLATAPEQAEALGKLSVFSPAQQAASLDVAIKLLHHQRHLDHLSWAEHKAQQRPLLLARAKLDIASTDLTIPTPHRQPANNHGRSRWQLGWHWQTGQVADQNEGQATIGWRFVHHDELDAALTDDLGTKVVAWDFQFSKTKPGWTLNQLEILGLRSLSARNVLVQPYSWQFSIGSQRQRRDSSERGATLIYADAGGGWAWGNEHWRLYTLLVSDLNVGYRLDSEWRWAAGLQAGLIYQTPMLWQQHLSLRLEWDQRFAIAGDQRPQRRLDLGVNWAFSQDWAARVNISQNKLLTNDDWLSSAQLLWYF